jgi:F-type H+-transporting ATPase subunit b
MVSIDESVFFQIANFLLLIWVLNIVLYRPIRNMLIQRRDKVNGLEEGIQTVSMDAREKGDAFDVGIKEARTKGLKEKEKFLQEASAAEKEIIREINEKAQADLAEVRQKISKDAKEVMATLQKEVDVFANSIGQKVLGRAV